VAPLVAPERSVLAPYQGVRTLVTGASGFIGRWIARLLSRAGSDLILASRDPAALRSVIDQLEINGEAFAVDLADKAAVDALIRRVRPAVTFHLAGYGVDRNETDEGEARRVNTQAVGSLASAVARWGAPGWPGPQLLHAGTAQEYGASGGDLDEDSPALPTTMYGKTKLDGTVLLMERSRDLKLRALTVRLFTVYGPGEHAGRLLPSLIQAAPRSEEVRLTAGTQRRDFAYVGDVAEGFLRLGASEGAGHFIVNLATGRLTSVREFVGIAAAIIGLPTERLHFGVLPTRSDELEHDAVKLVRLRELTGGWQPRTSIGDGVRATVAHLAGG